MSTNNFYNRNARHVYAFECEEEFDYEDTVRNLTATMEDRYSELWSEADKNDREENESNSYPGNVLGYLQKNKYVAGCDFGVRIQVVVRSGYYGGANFDWNLSICYHTEQSEIQFTKSEVAEVLEYAGVNPGMAAMQARNVCRWIEETVDDMADKAEIVMGECSTPLNKIGQFSNGEAVYESVK